MDVVNEYNFPISLTGTTFDSIARHIGPDIPRKIPALIDKYKCHGYTAVNFITESITLLP